MKIVINGCHGGFGLSDKAMQRYCDIACIEYESVTAKWGGMSLFYKAGHAKDDNFVIDEYKFERDDKILVHVVETLKEEANGMCANLKVVEIPDDVKWVIQEYDGLESVHEEHRVWE